MNECCSIYESCANSTATYNANNGKIELLFKKNLFSFRINFSNFGTGFVALQSSNIDETGYLDSHQETVFCTSVGIKSSIFLKDVRQTTTYLLMSCTWRKRFFFVLLYSIVNIKWTYFLHVFLTVLLTTLTGHKDYYFSTAGHCNLVLLNPSSNEFTELSFGRYLVSIFY